jgi:hypothetical protein
VPEEGMLSYYHEHPGRDMEGSLGVHLPSVPGKVATFFTWNGSREDNDGEPGDELVVPFYVFER